MFLFYEWFIGANVEQISFLPATTDHSEKSVGWTKKRNTGFMANILFELLGIHDGESHREGVVME